MKPDRLIRFPALTCLVLLAGCGFGQSRQAAEKVVTAHYQAISTNGYNSLLSNYGSQFFAKTKREEWAQTLKLLGTKLGSFQSHRITEWNVQKGTSAGGFETYVKIAVQSTYSKYPAQEHFTLFKGPKDKDFKIIGHDIRSDGLLKE